MARLRKPAAPALSAAPNPPAPAASQSRFGNWSDGMIADEWGDLDARIDALDAEIAALKGEFDVRKLKVATGEKFVVLKSTGTQMRFDSAAAKRKHGQTWYDALKKKTKRTSYKVESLAAEDVSP